MIGFAIFAATAVCFIFAITAGILAADFAKRGIEPQHEFVCRQATGGAWVFGVLTVTIPLLTFFIPETPAEPAPAPADTVQQDTAK
jgi:hypothetical protein